MLQPPAIKKQDTDPLYSTKRIILSILNVDYNLNLNLLTRTNRGRLYINGIQRTYIIGKMPMDIELLLYRNNLADINIPTGSSLADLIGLTVFSKDHSLITKLNTINLINDVAIIEGNPITNLILNRDFDLFEPYTNTKVPFLGTSNICDRLFDDTKYPFASTNNVTMKGLLTYYYLSLMFMHLSDETYQDSLIESYENSFISILTELHLHTFHTTFMSFIKEAYYVTQDLMMPHKKYWYRFFPDIKTPTLDNIDYMVKTAVTQMCNVLMKLKWINNSNATEARYAMQVFTGQLQNISQNTNGISLSIKSNSQLNYYKDDNLPF